MIGSKWGVRGKFHLSLVIFLLHWEFMIMALAIKSNFLRSECAKTGIQAGYGFKGKNEGV